MQIVIRSFEASDAEAYLELLDLLDRESTFLLWEPGERSIEPSALRLRAERADRVDGVHLVVELAGELVGFLVAHRGAVRRVRHRADFAMAVRSTHHGRGIGRQLLSALDHWAIEVGIERLELTVMAHNSRAIALYEQAGYLHEGRKRDAISVNGSAVDELVMGKRLNGGAAR